VERLEVGVQLEGLHHLEVLADHQEPRGEPVERVSTGREHAAALVEPLQDACRGGDALRHRFERRMDDDARLGGVGTERERARDVPAEISAIRRGAWQKARADRHLAGDPVDAEGAEVVAHAVPGDHVPAKAGVNDPVWLHHALGLLCASVVVAKAELLVVAAGAGEGREQGGVDRCAAAFDGHDARPERVRASPEALRKDLFELHERTERGFLDAEHGAPRRGAEADDDRERFVVGEVERGSEAPAPSW
jgi:hypothetical protein